MFRSTEFYIFDEDESHRLAARSDEIKLDNIYKINAFISSYLKYLADSVVDKSDDNTDATPGSDKEEAEDLRQLVVEIQKLLNAVGCNAGVIDGIWGRKTQAAAVLFAKTAKLPTSDDNLISAQFVKRLRAAPNDFCPKQKVKPKTKTITSKSKIIEPFAPGRYLAFSTCELGSKIGTEAHVTLIKKSSAWEKYSVQFFHRSSKLGTATIQVSTGFKGFTMKLNKGVSSKLFQFETFRTGYHVAKERNGCKFHLNMAKTD